VDFSCCAFLGGALRGRDAGVFELRAVAPDGGFLAAHARDVGGAGGGGGAGAAAGGCGSVEVGGG
jgi:hypothetical protein